jgi:pyochelin synthetase
VIDVEAVGGGGVRAAAVAATDLRVTTCSGAEARSNFHYSGLDGRRQSLAFDLSVFDIFGLLAVGGCVVLPKDEDRANPAAWAQLCEEQRITLWDSVPGVFQMLVDFLEQTQEPQEKKGKSLGLRLALLSGDWIPVELPRKAKRLMPLLELIGLGGATEASIWSNCYPIWDVEAQRRSIPYGKPLGNQRFTY